MTIRYYFLTLYILCVQILFAQSTDRIDSLFQEYRDQPGCAVAVYHQGEIRFAKGYGYANLDYDIHITPETVFDIGSVSKQFTATCILLLESEGLLSLDDPVRKYIPEIPEYSGGEITVRHLLHHTSGLRDYLMLMILSGRSFDDHFTEEMGLDLVCRQKALTFSPGSEFQYSNSGYLLLAVIVRRVSGKSIGAFAREKIFETLEMNHTLVYEDGKRVIKNRAIGYAKKGDLFVRNHHFDFELGGDGQVYTTVKDFFKWNESFRSGFPGMGKAFLQKLQQRGVLTNGDTLDYAMGLLHGNFMGFETLEHSGSWGGFRANYLRIPEKDLAVLVLSNNETLNAVRKSGDIAALFLERALEKTRVQKDALDETISFIELPAMAMKPFEGVYELQPGVEITVVVEADTLRIHQGWDGTAYPVVPVSPDRFVVPEEPGIVFAFSGVMNGQAETVTITQQGPTMVLERKKAFELPRIDLTFYTGRYYSEELDVYYNIFLENGGLIVTTKYNPPLELKTMEEDQFGGPGITLHFTKSEDRVTGFTMDAGPVTGIAFVKEHE